MEGLGYSYEGKKDYEKAFNAYQKIVDMGESFQVSKCLFRVWDGATKNWGRIKKPWKITRPFLKVYSKIAMMTNTVLRKISNLEK